MQAIEPRQNIVKAALYSVGAGLLIMLSVFINWMYFGSAVYQDIPADFPPVQLVVGLLLLLSIIWPLVFSGLMIHRAARSIMPLSERFRDNAFVALFVVAPLVMTAVAWAFRSNAVFIALIVWIPMLPMSNMNGDFDRMMEKFVAFLKTIGPAHKNEA